MNSNIIMAAVAVVIAVAGGATLLQPKKPAQPPPAQWHACYQEDVKGPVATYVADEYGVPKGWHRQIVAIVTTRKPSPEGLPANIMAMPDLSGAYALPNLRVALAEEQADGKRNLRDAVEKFRGMAFDDLFSGGAARDAVREILFLWAGVAEVAADSRGPFIDGRELAFLEKILENPFYQLGRYPNPLPISASYMKDAFTILRNHYFAELAAQGAGRQLFTYNGHYLGFDTGTLRNLADRAADLASPADKLHFWQRVVGAIPYDVMPVLHAEDRRLLDARIRESTPELNLQNVQASLKSDLAKGPDYYDRLGRKVIFKIIYSNKMNSRLTCYLYPDKA